MSIVCNVLIPRRMYTQSVFIDVLCVSLFFLFIFFTVAHNLSPPTPLIKRSTSIKAFVCQQFYVVITLYKLETTLCGAIFLSFKNKTCVYTCCLLMLRILPLPCSPTGEIAGDPSELRTKEHIRRSVVLQFASSIHQIGQNP